MIFDAARKGGSRWSNARPVLVISALFCSSLAAENHGIKVYGWSGAKGAVDRLIEHYEATTGQDIEFSLINHKLYVSDIEERQIYGGEGDVFSFPPFEAIRFLNAGWMEYLPPDKVYEQLNADLYENVREGMLHEGKILGLNQFASAMVLPLVDEQRFQEIGLDSNALPADWASLYEQVNERALAGYKNIYLPHWFDSVFGLAWGFIAEVLNRGGHIIDPETHRVVMTESEGPAFDTLAGWRSAIDSGAADVAALDMTYPEYVKAFSSGKYAVSPQAMGRLFNSSIFDLSAAPVRDVSLLPRVQQNWGLLGISIAASASSVPNASDDTHQSRVRDFLYNYAFGRGEYRHWMPKKWLELGLFSGYRSFMESPEAQKILRRQALEPSDIPQILDAFKHAPYPSGIWKVIWYPEFEIYLKEVLREFISTNELGPEDVISLLNTKLSSLRIAHGD